MKAFYALLAPAIIALPLSAHAASAPGPYVKLNTGINIMGNEDAHAGNANGQVDLDPGFAISGAVGWNFGGGPRVEVEGSYRSNDISGETGFGGESAKGTESKTGVMFNALYEFDAAPWVSPYIGFGIGYQSVEEPGAKASFGTISAVTYDSSQGSFAYQAIVGAAFPIPSVAGLDLTLEYRYLSLPSERTYKGQITIQGVGSFPTSDTSTDNYNHSIMAGVRYAF
jgi:OOP family OmpA-OmpF porin